MKFKNIATILVAAAVAIGGISVAPVKTEAATVMIDGYSYSSEVVNALNHLNGIRSNMGLDPVKLNPFLTKAAENHANYIDSNSEYEHTEVPGKKGYTGETSSSRMTAVGFNRSGYVTNEVLSFHTSSIVEAINTFMDTAYHRAPLVSVSTVEVGLAVSGKNVVGEIATVSTPKDGVAMYPYNGQTNVPLSFDGFETPNPLEQFGVNRSGYILSLNVGGVALNETNSKVSLTSSAGKSLSTFVFGDLGTLFILSKDILSPSTTYTVSITYTPSYGLYAGQTSTKSWSFTTTSSGSSGSNTGGTTTPVNSKPQPSSTIPATGNGSNTGKYTADNIAVKINQAIVSVNPKPILKSGSTFIPLRGVLEKLGASLIYDSKTKSIFITEGNTKISLTIGSKRAYVNGALVTLSTAPFVNASGSTYVPLRFVSQALGASVAWDQENYIISIETK
ncbi:stalk domain-containing protein [Paenibacillus tengchongensis]|uniref:stalk domain-containing protein n=1 Tax=Paenibacillus tengchongensis TaxID=2608684 RepID=UPI00124F092E|nr:stalk domain-containing protein [Paenibacillus tengchongensis]